MKFKVNMKDRRTFIFNEKDEDVNMFVKMFCSQVFQGIDCEHDVFILINPKEISSIQEIK